MVSFIFNGQTFRQPLFHTFYLFITYFYSEKKRRGSVCIYQTFQPPLYHYVFQFYKSFLRIFLPFLFFWWYFIALGNVLPSLRRSFPLGFNKPISCHLHSYPHASLAPWYWSYFWRGRNGYIKLKRSIWSLMEHGKAPCIACTWEHDAAVLKLIPCSTFCH